MKISDRTETVTGLKPTTANPFLLHSAGEAKEEGEKSLMPRKADKGTGTDQGKG